MERHGKEYRMSLTKDDLQAIAGLFAPIEARMEAGSY